MSDDQGRGSSPAQPAAETSSAPRWWSRVPWTGVLVGLTVIGMLVGAAVYLEGGFSRVSRDVSDTAAEIRKEIGGKLEKQTEAINENTKGQAVLEERVSGVKTELGNLKRDVAKDVERLEKKIDGLSGVKPAKY